MPRPRPKYKYEVGDVVFCEPKEFNYPAVAPERASKGRIVTRIAPPHVMTGVDITDSDLNRYYVEWEKAENCYVYETYLEELTNA